MAQNANVLGDIIYKHRMDKKMTQDEFGSNYNVSGPAIFKFEKGYVRPSLDLWLRIALDASVNERRAVLLWLQAKLPKQYQEYVDINGATAKKTTRKSTTAKGEVDYSRLEGRTEMRNEAAKDKTLPKGMRELLNDDDLWALFKPTGHEINMLRNVFGPLGEGRKASYRDSLRLIREFSHSY